MGRYVSRLVIELPPPPPPFPELELRDSWMRALIATNVTLPGVSQPRARNSTIYGLTSSHLLEFPRCSHDSSPTLPSSATLSASRRRISAQVHPSLHPSPCLGLTNESSSPLTLSSRRAGSPRVGSCAYGRS